MSKTTWTMLEYAALVPYLAIVFAGFAFIGGGISAGLWAVETVALFSWIWYCRRRKGEQFILLRMFVHDPGPKITLDPQLHPPDDGQQRPVPPTTAWEARQRRRNNAK